MSVYSYILEKAVLSEDHKTELKKKRGFSDQTIADNRFFSGGRYLLDIEAEIVSKFGKDELIESGVCVDSGKGLTLSPMLLDNRIIIPYIDRDGACTLLRPHKLGLKNVPIQIYQERNLTGNKSIILTEGEFKAAAGCQLGFPTLAVPGISSFSDSNFPKLVALLNRNGVRNVWIMFDNEVKDDPKFAERYKENPADRFDTQYYAYFMAYTLEKEGFNTRVAWLPDGWRVQGKIDIDGALAQGKTKDDFMAIINTAKTWREFVEDQPKDVQAIFKRKNAKKYFRSHIRKEFGRYVAVRHRAKHEFEEIISNFTLRIVSTHETPEGMIRSVQMINEFGESASFAYISPEEMGNEAFKTFCFAKGNFIWTGHPEDLLNIWKAEFLEDDGRHIIEPNHIGWIPDESMWLFGNVALKDGKEMRPDKNGVFWTEKKGYKPIALSEDNSMPFISLKAPAIAEILGNLGDTIGIDEAKLVMGWTFSVAYLEEIFALYSCFPFLFLTGKKGSGKSHVADWLMSFFGVEQSGKQAGDSTTVGLQRCLEYYSSLPVFIDEYKNTQKITIKNGFFRNCYNRQSSSKGIKSNFGIRNAKIRGTLLFAGEETPEDAALLSRCIPVLVTLKRRTSDHYEWFQSQKHGFSYHFLEAIRHKDTDRFVKIMHQAKEFFTDLGMDDRMAINYSVAAAGYAVAFDDADVAFVKWMGAEVRRVKKDQDSESTVDMFFADLLTLKLTGRINEKYWEVSDGRVYLYFHGLYNIWSEDYRKRKGEAGFKASSIRDYLKEEPGFLDSRCSKRLGKDVFSCVVFSLEDCREELRNLVGDVSGEVLTSSHNVSADNLL